MVTPFYTAASSPISGPVRVWPPNSNHPDPIPPRALLLLSLAPRVLLSGPSKSVFYFLLASPHLLIFVQRLGLNPSTPRGLSLTPPLSGSLPCSPQSAARAPIFPLSLRLSQAQRVAPGSHVSRIHMFRWSLPRESGQILPLLVTSGTQRKGHCDAPGWVLRRLAASTRVSTRRPRLAPRTESGPSHREYRGHLEPQARGEPVDEPRPQPRSPPGRESREHPT